MIVKQFCNVDLQLAFQRPDCERLAGSRLAAFANGNERGG